MFEKRSDYEKGILAAVFQLSNRLQVFLDRQLIQDGITAKQFFMMFIIDSFNDQYPTFTEISDRLGSSRQNAKQLALKLESKGFVNISVDTIDSRSKRVSLTKKAEAYWSDRDINDMSAIQALFSNVSTTHLKNIHQGMEIISDGILSIDM